MKNTVRRYKFAYYELRVAIDLLNAKHLNQKLRVIYDSAHLICSFV